MLTVVSRQQGRRGGREADFGHSLYNVVRGPLWNAFRAFQVSGPGDPIAPIRRSGSMAVTRHFVFAALAFSMVSGVAMAEPLSVATEASFPPFSKTEADGSYSGFEIDLGNAVCEKAGFECTWVKQDFDGAIAALNAGKFDMIFSSMSIKPERAKVADFSIPYYDTPSSLFAAPGSIGGAEDLDGKKLGVYGGSTQDSYAQAHFEGAEIRPYENIDQMSADLKAGRIDAIFVETLAGQEFLKSENGAGYAQIGEPFVGPELGAGAGAMMRKGDERMARINDALKALYADGTFDALQTEYFGDTSVRADHLWQ
jgi:lysine-arginine-ornithine-binding protein